jgi:hypothetical protein
MLGHVALSRRAAQWIAVAAGVVATPFILLLALVLALVVWSPDLGCAIDFDGSGRSPGLIETDEGAVQVIPPVCFTETLLLDVSEDDPDGPEDTVWSITAVPPATAEPITIGTVPVGFTEDVAMSGPLPDQFIVTLWGTPTDGEGGIAEIHVARADLSRDAILTEAGPVDLAAFPGASCP